MGSIYSRLLRVKNASSTPYAARLPGIDQALKSVISDQRPFLFLGSRDGAAVDAILSAGDGGSARRGKKA
jgi:hypothetical protein